MKIHISKKGEVQANAQVHKTTFNLVLYTLSSNYPPYFQSVFARVVIKDEFGAVNGHLWIFST